MKNKKLLTPITIRPESKTSIFRIAGNPLFSFTFILSILFFKILMPIRQLCSGKFVITVKDGIGEEPKISTIKYINEQANSNSNQHCYDKIEGKGIFKFRFLFLHFMKYLQLILELSHKVINKARNNKELTLCEV